MNQIQGQGATVPSVASAATQAIKPPFYVMGITKQKLFFFSKRTQAPISLSIARLCAPWIYNLAPLDFWQSHFPTSDKRCPDGVRWRIVADHLIGEAYETGEYKGVPEFMKSLKKGAK